MGGEWVVNGFSWNLLLGDRYDVIYGSTYVDDLIVESVWSPTTSLSSQKRDGTNRFTVPVAMWKNHCNLVQRWERTKQTFRPPRAVAKTLEVSSYLSCQVRHFKGGWDRSVFHFSGFFDSFWVDMFGYVRTQFWKAWAAASEELLLALGARQAVSLSCSFHSKNQMSLHVGVVGYILNFSVCVCSSGRLLDLRVWEQRGWEGWEVWEGRTARQKDWQLKIKWKQNRAE